MGMFDSVWIECPHCGKAIQEQTKAGDCCCFSYDLNEAPPILKMDISNYPIECYECGEKFIVRTQTISVSNVYKYKDDD